ncbi:MAG: CAP domain-containing protein [Labilithrix sp.]
MNASLLLAGVVAVGCDLGYGKQQAAQQPQQPQPQPQPQPPPGYYYPPQPQPQPYPSQQPAPAPSQSPAPAPSQPPAPAPSQQPAQPYNPWVTMLGDLLKGGAPPIPWPNLPQPTPTPPQPTPSTVDTRGLELANAINQYRQQNGLPPIPISKSLSKVADAHVKDLSTATPMAAQCNDHSWTNRGTWTPCCYTPDHAQAKCMWYKPSEITPFKGTGFEISIGQPGEKKAGLVLDAKQAISFWSSSAVHNDVMLNKGQWASMSWKAMGAGIVDSHASAWFSDQADTVTELKPGK